MTSRITGRKREGRGRHKRIQQRPGTQTVLNATDFKAHALAVMRKVRDTGEAVTVTSHGRPLVRIEPLHDEHEPTGYGCMKGAFEWLVVESDEDGAPAAGWGTLREWRTERSR
jgi:prevent-host-death family protein